MNVTLGPAQRALKRPGLPQRRSHDLRHTFATRRWRRERILLPMSRALGHTSVATSADVYMRVTPAMRDRLAQRMEQALG